MLLLYFMKLFFGGGKGKGVFSSISFISSFKELQCPNKSWHFLMRKMNESKITVKVVLMSSNCSLYKHGWVKYAKKQKSNQNKKKPNINKTKHVSKAMVKHNTFFCIWQFGPCLVFSM